MPSKPRKLAKKRHLVKQKQKKLESKLDTSLSLVDEERGAHATNGVESEDSNEEEITAIVCQLDEEEEEDSYGDPYADSSATYQSYNPAMMKAPPSAAVNDRLIFVALAEDGEHIVSHEAIYLPPSTTDIRHHEMTASIQPIQSITVSNTDTSLPELQDYQSPLSVEAVSLIDSTYYKDYDNYFVSTRFSASPSRLSALQANDLSKLLGCPLFVVRDASIPDAYAEIVASTVAPCPENKYAGLLHPNLRVMADDWGCVLPEWRGAVGIVTVVRVDMLPLSRLQVVALGKFCDALGRKMRRLREEQEETGVKKKDRITERLAFVEKEISMEAYRKWWLAFRSKRLKMGEGKWESVGAFLDPKSESEIEKTTEEMPLEVQA